MVDTMVKIIELKAPLSKIVNVCLDQLSRRVIKSYKTSLLVWLATSHAARTDFPT